MAERSRWRLCIDGDQRGARNMALDFALLEGVIEGTSTPTLRLYGWVVPCLSLGRNQSRDAANLGFCREHGIEVVRRPTGGRAVLHHLELTYSVIAPLAVSPLPRIPLEAYTLICAGLVKACRRLGIDAELVGEADPAARGGPQSINPCFKGPGEGEVVAGGRKLIGSAMRARRDVILQHGTILLDWDSRLQAGSMGLADDSILRPAVTTFTDQLPVLPDRREIESIVASSLAGALGIDLAPGEIDASESTRADSLEADFSILTA